MLHIPVILGHRPRSVYRRDEMSSTRLYDKVLLQNAHSEESAGLHDIVPPQSAHSDESARPYDKVSPQNARSDESARPYDKVPPQNAHSDESARPYDKVPPQNAHSDESARPYDKVPPQNAHSDESARPYDKVSPQNAHSDESARPYDKVSPQNARSDESGLKRTSGGLSTRQQHECRNMKDNFKRKSSSSSHYSRHSSPYKRASYFSRKSSMGHKYSPHSRSGSSGRHSPKRNEQHSSHGSQHRKSKHAHASYRWHSEKPEGGKKRPGQSLKISRDTHPSSSSIPSSKILDKLNTFDGKGLPEAVSRQAVEKPEVADDSDVPKISELEVEFTEPLLMDQPQEPESDRTDGTELTDQLTNRFKAIASKTKEIEQAYYQDCETFGMVVKMLVEKDPSLEKSIQFALRQNLHEISEQCVEELRQFIAEYDAAS